MNVTPARLSVERRPPPAHPPESVVVADQLLVGADRLPERPADAEAVPRQVDGRLHERRPRRPAVRLPLPVEAEHLPGDPDRRAAWGRGADTGSEEDRVKRANVWTREPVITRSLSCLHHPGQSKDFVSLFTDPSAITLHVHPRWSWRASGDGS